MPGRPGQFSEGMGKPEGNGQKETREKQQEKKNNNKA